MFWPKPHTPRCRLTVRVAVVPVILFYALASGRALVPGLCATQSELNQQQDAKSCCSPENGAKHAAAEASVQQQVEHTPCAFCKLAQAVVQPLVFFLYEQHTLSLLRDHAQEILPADLPEVWDPASPRDPPAAS